jgi:SAM-dependent methyltransferase
MRENNERKISQHNLEERYFERMAHSVGDKRRILAYLPPITDVTNPPSILDVGAGGGEFADALREFGYNVTALDASDDAIMRIRKVFPKLTTAKFLANHADEIGENVFDVVVCSSILHEVFSYGDDVHQAGHISSLERAFASFAKVLKPNGLLVIRDGVKPDNFASEGTITVGSEGKVEDIFKYLDMCPFANGVASGERGHKIALAYKGDGVFTGKADSLMEAAYTYTWGLDSFPRETQELYGVMTLNEYAEFIEAHGFTVEEKFAYRQEGYPKHLEGKLELNVDGVINDWFNSNAIWVARKN